MTPNGEMQLVGRVDREARVAESESTGPDKLVSQVVSLWTFVFSRLITAILTLLIIWLISGNLLSSITTKLALELGSKTALLESHETIGLKDKIWIAALIGFVSILYINVSLVSGVTNVIPVNVQRRPLANPSPMMTNALALLWALKSDIEDYSDLRLYVEYQFIKTTQASDVEKLAYYTELKKARRATMQARTSIYFALFAIIFIQYQISFDG